MKYLLAFCLILCLACKEHKEDFNIAQNIPSNIDGLKTEQEVQDFVQNLNYPSVKVRDFNDSIYFFKALKKFELKKIQDIDGRRNNQKERLIKMAADSLKVNKSFYKGDFDNNGYTDLIIIGSDNSCSGSGLCDYSVYGLMNFANDSINPINLILNHPFFGAIIPKVTTQNGMSSLNIFKPEDYHSDAIPVKLAYKYGTLVEQNKEPKEYLIEKIEYSAKACFGRCPIFEITIDSNRNAKLNAIEYNSSDPNLFEYEITNELKGNFETVIDKQSYNDITGLLNYMDFPNLADYYSISATDNPSCNLTITYNQGKTKTIRDYGKTGTYGLQKIYDMLSNLKTNQDWE